MAQGVHALLLAAGVHLLTQMLTWQRIKELTEDKSLLQYRWDGGSIDNYKEADKEFEQQAPFTSHRPGQPSAGAADGQRFWSSEGRYVPNRDGLRAGISLCFCVRMRAVMLGGRAVRKRE